MDVYVLCPCAEVLTLCPQVTVTATLCSTAARIRDTEDTNTTANRQTGTDTEDMDTATKDMDTATEDTDTATKDTDTATEDTRNLMVRTY